MNVKIQHKKEFDETTIYISSLFDFAPQEIENHAKYHLTIDVKGRDYGQSFSKDEILYHSKEEFFIDDEILPKIRDNQYTFKRALIFSNPSLDEDQGSEEDEIYINIELKSLSKGEIADCLSNLVKDHFEKV